MSARVRFVATALLALAICAAILHGNIVLAGAAWIISLASGLTGLWIDQRTVSGSDTTTISGLARHVLRMMVLAAILAAAGWKLGEEAERFVAATLAGYFVFLAEEIWRLHLRGLKA